VHACLTAAKGVDMANWIQEHADD